MIFRCLCKSFKNNPYKCQKPTSSFCKLKSIGDSDSKLSELHSLWKNPWQFNSDLLSEAEKRLLPTDIQDSTWHFLCQVSGDLPCSFKSTLPFLYHPKLTWCYCMFNSTLTITFHYTDSSISIIDYAILAYTLWDPSIYLQSTHLCVRYRYTLFLKELSPTYLHVPVQTTKIIFSNE